MGSLIYLLLPSKATKKFIRAKITPSRGEGGNIRYTFFVHRFVASIRYYCLESRNKRIFRRSRVSILLAMHRERINRTGVGKSMEKVVRSQS